MEKEATLYAKKDGVVKKVSSLHVKEGEVKELHARNWVWKRPAPLVTLFNISHRNGAMVSQGDSLTYNIEWHNNTGTAAEMELRVVHTSADYVSSTPEPTTTEYGITTFNLGWVAPGESGTIDLTTRVRDGRHLMVSSATKGDYINISAQMYVNGKMEGMSSAANPMPGLDENCVGSSPDICEEPMLNWKSGTETLVGDTVYVNDVIIYEVHYKNGHEDEKPVYIKIKLDPATDYNEKSSSKDFTYNALEHTITARREIAGGSSCSEVFCVNVNEKAVPVGLVSVQASVRVGNDPEVLTVVIENPLPFEKD